MSFPFATGATKGTREEESDYCWILTDQNAGPVARQIAICC
jgi:hypothetical protein